MLCLLRGELTCKMDVYIYGGACMQTGALPDGRQAVRDDDGRAALDAHQAVEGRLHEPLALYVQ